MKWPQRPRRNTTSRSKPKSETVEGAGWLKLAGGLSLLAALLHLVIIFGGPDYYRFFGAGEEMAQAAEHGKSFPAYLTAIIAIILTICAMFAFSGAGLIGRLPLLRSGLLAITSVYLVRGLAIIPAWILVPERITPFDDWSSAVVTIYGAVHAIGLWLSWGRLSAKQKVL